MGYSLVRLGYEVLSGLKPCNNCLKSVHANLNATFAGHDQRMAEGCVTIACTRELSSMGQHERAARLVRPAGRRRRQRPARRPARLAGAAGSALTLATYPVTQSASLSPLPGTGLCDGMVGVLGANLMVGIRLCHFALPCAASGAHAWPGHSRDSVYHDDGPQQLRVSSTVAKL